MDNKIILELIKKDLEEIRMLIEVLEQGDSNEQLIIDITTSKAKTLLDEISLLKADIKSEDIVKEIITKEETHEIVETIIPPTIKEENIIEEVSVPEIEEEQTPVPETGIKASDSESTPVEKEKTEIEEKKEIIETKAEIIISEKEIPSVNIEPESPKVEEPVAEKAEEFQLEETTIITERTVEEYSVKELKILGENFTKEPSLNERFSSINDKKSKVVGKPVTSIKGAIGLNDKFMYIRELFNNDSEKLNSTIEALDNASSLIAAVEYLEQNFKWQKNETSLKFMELVKRRFEN